MAVTTNWLSNVKLPSGTAVVPCPAYVSTKGWDACTGLGRIDGAALLTPCIAGGDSGRSMRTTRSVSAVGENGSTTRVPTFEGGRSVESTPSQPPIIGSQKTGDFIVAGRVETSGIRGDCTYLRGHQQQQRRFGGGQCGRYWWRRRCIRPQPRKLLEHWCSGGVGHRLRTLWCCGGQTVSADRRRGGRPRSGRYRDRISSS